MTVHEAGIAGDRVFFEGQEIVADGRTVYPIPIGQVRESATNPRRTFGKMDDLVESVRAVGVLQPILLRVFTDHALQEVYFQVVFGARRYRAATAAGLLAVPAMIRTLSDDQVLEMQLIENLLREDVHPLEEADGYDAWMHRTKGTVEDLAAKVAKSVAYIYARLKLRSLAKDGRAAFLDGRLSASTALLVARIPDHGQQKEAVAAITNGARGFDGNSHPMSFREAATYVKTHFMLHLVDAPFDTTDAELYPKAGACTACPLRTGNSPGLFDDVGKADMCTSLKCWSEKVRLHGVRVLADAKARGLQVVPKKEALQLFDEHRNRAAYGAPLIDLESEAPYTVDDRQRTWSKLLGKDAPAPVAAAQDHRGRVHELHDVRALTAAAQEKGVVSLAGRHQLQRNDKGRRQKAATALCRRATELMLQDLVLEIESADELDEEFWREVISALAAVSWHDAVAVAVKRRGLGKAGDRAEAALERALKTMDERQAIALLAELCALRHANFTYADTGDPVERVAKLGSLFGLKAKVYAARAKKELDEKKKPKKAARAAPAKGAKGKASKRSKAASVVCDECGCTEDGDVCEAHAGLDHVALSYGAGSGLLCAECLAPKPKAGKGKRSRVAARDPAPSANQCERCECTEDNACIGGMSGEEPCSWVNEAKTICSECATPEEIAVAVARTEKRRASAAKPAKRKARKATR